MELVDTLIPPTFTKSGIVKPRNQAYLDGDWLGAFNLWVIQAKPFPAILYQLRSPQSSWAPNLLDVTVGGHYQADESALDGLREAKEELNKDYDPKLLCYMGRKMNVSPDENNVTRHNIVEIYFVVDNSPLTSYQLDAKEVSALVVCPLADLIQTHIAKTTFTASGIDHNCKHLKFKVNQKSFPQNWDNYHYKIALLAARFLNGESNIIY